MGWSECEEKCKTLLRDEKTYRSLEKDLPPLKQMEKITKMLQQIKKDGRLDTTIYNKIYPTAETIL